MQSRKYLEFVCDQECCVSHRSGEGIQAHHIKGFDMMLGKKVSDLLTIPLYHELHDELHRHGWRAFETKYQMSQQAECLKTILKAVAQEKLIVK